MIEKPLNDMRQNAKLRELRRKRAVKIMQSPFGYSTALVERFLVLRPPRIRLGRLATDVGAIWREVQITLDIR
jgi:hypothetical protein